MASKDGGSDESKVSDERKSELLSKFKNALVAAARKKRLQKLIETKRREQGIDVKEGNNDSPFVPCSDDCIDKFLELAKPHKDDIIVDLGCGDGRVLIAAAKHANCKCIGIEIQPKVVEKAKEKVNKNGLNHLVEIRECDFKSIECKQILQSATIVFTFLLPKIMPLVTNILMESVSNGCRVISYIFDLNRIKKGKERKKIIQINKWSYPSFGCTNLEYSDDEKGVFLKNIHPELFEKFEGCERGSYQLLEVNGKKLDDIKSLYHFLECKRYLHEVLTENYQNRHCEDDKERMKILIEFRDENEQINANDLEAVRPNNTIEVVKKFKSGSEMRSDLKMYEFPLRDSDFGWVNPKGASRIVHAKK